MKTSDKRIIKLWVCSDLTLQSVSLGENDPDLQDSDMEFDGHNWTLSYFRLFELIRFLGTRHCRVRLEGSLANYPTDEDGCIAFPHEFIYVLQSLHHLKKYEPNAIPTEVFRAVHMLYSLKLSKPEALTMDVIEGLVYFVNTLRS